MARIIRINAHPNAIGGRFCRTGLCFGTVPTNLTEDELTPEQLAALQAEPMLVVEITEEVKPTAPQARAEAKAKEEAKAAPQEDEAPAVPAADAPGTSADAPKPDAKPKAETKGKAPVKEAAKPATKEGGK